MRAVVYTRVSSDRAGDELGVTRQREDAEKLVAQRGWTLARTFTDNGVSAAGRAHRPQFAAMLRAVTDGEADAIVAWSLDRLVRTARDRLDLVETCRDRGVIVALVRGSDMDPRTPAGRFTLGMLGEVAELEIDQKSDRQRRAHLQAAQQGRRIGGRRPFGYEQDGMTLIPAEAQAIAEGYANLLAGDTLREIARQWNARGLGTGQAPHKRTHLGERSPWRSDSVRRVLENPRNAGLRAYLGEVVGPAAWPAIVARETWEAARAVLAEPTRRTGGAGPDTIQLLTALALCGAPGCGLTVHGGGAGHGKPIYRCRTSTMEAVDRPDVPGPHVSRLAAPVEAFVTRVVIERLSRPDAADLLTDHERPDVPALRDQATALRARLNSLAVEFADGELTPAQLRAATERLRARIVATEAQLADAGRVDLLGPLVSTEDVRAVWDALSVDRRRAVVDTLMAVTLHPVGRGTRTFRPESVAITWRSTTG